MTSHIVAIAEELHCSDIVDVGAGLGYLTTNLSIHGLRAVCILQEMTWGLFFDFGKVALESHQERCSISARRHEELRQKAARASNKCTLQERTDGANTVARKLPSGVITGASPGAASGGTAASHTSLLVTVECNLRPDAPLDVAQSVIRRALLAFPHGQAIQQLPVIGDLHRPYLLCALHGCGDLSPTALRLACASDDVRGCCIVGCCYHELSEAHGFPMSWLVAEELERTSLGNEIARGGYEHIFGQV